VPDVWTLHEEPYRHYKLNGKWNIGGVRIASVTQVLAWYAHYIAYRAPKLADQIRAELRRIEEKNRA
jgi:hypothetical protein